jgi:hypothetical protein
MTSFKLHAYRWDTARAGTATSSRAGVPPDVGGVQNTL